MTCPFLTAVGATQVNPGSTVNDPESACEQVIFSGGGFSNIFPSVYPVKTQRTYPNLFFTQHACVPSSRGHQLFEEAPASVHQRPVQQQRQGARIPRLVRERVRAPFRVSSSARSSSDSASANYVIGINGEFGLVFGTSASSPVTGSLITLINDARIARGKRTVGFINPAVRDFTWRHV